MSFEQEMLMGQTDGQSDSQPVAPPSQSKLQSILAYADNARRVLSRNMKDLVTNPGDVYTQLDDRAKNYNENVVPTIASGSLYNRPMTEEEKDQRSIDMALDVGPMGVGVVKPKGGQWLSGNVEHATRTTLAPEHTIGLERTPSIHAPVNDWVRGPMTKYLRERFASPQDEVRLLADKTAAEAAATKTKAYTEAAKLRDPARASLMRSEADAAEEEALKYALHVPTNDLWVRNNNIIEHQNAGRWDELGQSPIGRTWERSADSQIQATPAGTVAADPFRAAEMPWLAKTPPETDIYSMSTMKPMGDTGLTHLTDELRNAINPASDVPAHLKLTPEIVKNMSMEKAVRHVAALNKWRADTKGMGNTSLRDAQPIISKFESRDNPEGFHVRQLKNEGDFADEGKASGHSLGGYEQEHLGGNPNYGYGGWDAVQSGRANVFAIRNGKNKSAATIETGPIDIWDRIGDDDPHIRGIWEDIVTKLQQKPGSPLNADFSDEAVAIMQKMPEFANKAHGINQLEGLRKGPIAPDALPFVQDFIRNPPSGKPWAYVADDVLSRTHMMDMHKASESYTPAQTRLLLKKFPKQRYIPTAEVEAVIEAAN